MRRWEYVTDSQKCKRYRHYRTLRIIVLAALAGYCVSYVELAFIGFALTVGRRCQFWIKQGGQILIIIRHAKSDKLMCL